MIPAIPVWCPHAFDRRGQEAGEGRIGLAIQYLDAFEHVSWEDAALKAPGIVAASLVLCLLDRFEWGQFAATRDGLVFYDLERLFPDFCPERGDGETWDEVAVRVSETADTYRTIAPRFLGEVLVKADRMGLSESLRLAVANAAAISSEEFMDIFDLKPHPLATRIGKIAADVAVALFGRAARVLCV